MTDYPKITLWRPHYNSVKPHVYTNKLIANELIKEHETLYEFRSKDPRTWVKIEDLTYKLKCNATYCIGTHKPKKHLVIKGVGTCSIQIDASFSSLERTGKDIYIHLDDFNSNMYVFTRNRNSIQKNKPQLPSYTISKKTNLPLFGYEHYWFHFDYTPTPTKRKCVEVE